MMTDVPTGPRSPEELALLNPALVAVVLHEAAEAWTQATRAQLPMALAFVVPPVVLVSFIRDELPRSKATSFATWIDRNPRIRMLFADVATSMVPDVRAGLLYGASGRLLEVEPTSVTALGRRSRSGAVIRDNTAEFKDIVKRAGFVGGWYAATGSPETILALWGVRP